MILTHGANSLAGGGGGDDPSTVIIGGREYKTVKIGNQEWLAENLDYKFNGVTIGPSGSGITNPAAWYYNNDETTYGIDGTMKCGLLYNWYAAELLNNSRSTLCPGWHIPTKSEYDTLISEVGTNFPNKVKAIDGAVGGNWPSGWNGTDDYGFFALPTGARINASSGNFKNVGSECCIWSINNGTISTGEARCLNLNKDPSFKLALTDKDKRIGNIIRLVKDAT